MVNNYGIPINILQGGLTIAQDLAKSGQQATANKIIAAVNAAGGVDPAGNSGANKKEPGFITSDAAYAFTNDPVKGKLCSSILVDKNGKEKSINSAGLFYVGSPASCDYSQGGMCYMKRVGFWLHQTACNILL